LTGLIGVHLDIWYLHGPHHGQWGILSGLDLRVLIMKELPSITVGVAPVKQSLRVISVLVHEY
jgi:hypothetical protein